MRKTLEYTGAPGLRYRTRRLLPGDLITCSEAEARLWMRTKKFRPAREIGELPPPPAALVRKASALDHDGNGKPGGSTTQPAGDEIKIARDEYFDKLGKRPFSGWDVIELRRRIAEAGA